MSEEGIH